MKARKLAKKVPEETLRRVMLYGDGVHNQPYDSGTVSMIIWKYGSKRRCICSLIEVAYLK